MFKIYEKTQDFKEPDDLIYYLVASNGLFQIKKTRFFKSNTLIFEPKGKKNLGWLEKHGAGIELTLPFKFPFELVQQIMEFFRRVCDKHNGSEAICLIYWSEEEKAYKIIVPEQKVEPSRVHCEVGKNPEGLTRVGTIHSHGSTRAFHSGVDDKDEKNDDGIHVTVGGVGSLLETPSISCSVVVDGQRQMLKPQDLIERMPQIVIPKDWMGKVKKAEVKTFDLAPSFGHPGWPSLKRKGVKIG